MPTLDELAARRKEQREYHEYPSRKVPFKKRNLRAIERQINLLEEAFSDATINKNEIGKDLYLILKRGYEKNLESLRYYKKISR